MKRFVTTPAKQAAFFAAIFLLACMPAFAQQPLNISSADFANGLSQFVSAQNTYNDNSTVGLQALVDQTGANQTWSFLALPFVLDTSTTNGKGNGIIAPYSSSFPKAASFPTATHVETIASGGNNLYFFIRVDQSGVYSLGISGDSMGTPIIFQTYTPPEENFAFPLTYQTAWSSTSVIGSEGYAYTEEIDGYVDGWGTYSIPGNAPVQALRIRTKTIDTYPSTIDSTPNGKDTIPGSIDTSYSFQWFNLSSFSASIDADANQNAMDASYNTPESQNIVLNNTPTSQYSISVGSNPLRSPTNVSFNLPSESQVRVSLMDPLGRVSQVLMNGMAHSGVNTLPLDPTNLMNGTYFLRIESAGNTSMQKLIVSH
jgi:hypothetical protein